MNFQQHYNYEKNCWWHKLRRNIASHVFWKGAARKLTSPKILSVGVSSGVEVEYLSKFGDVTGLEFSKGLVKYNKDRGLNVVYGDINECPLPDNSFDVVFAMRKLGASSASQTKVPGKLVNRVLYSIFSSEKRFLRWMRFPIGVSLIAICKKKG